MTYPFVQSRVDLGLRKGPILGFVVHHAEGGGTVGYLDGTGPDGNTHDVSVHYVIEYTGLIVQMLREDHMHSSIRTSAIRTTDDADGFYGQTARRAVLGDWGETAKTLGPNHSTIAVEIEGFAIQGPNAKQADALVALVADIRTRYPNIGLLGHRDFADYKQCPGRLIPWAALGGHGAPKEEAPMRPFPITPDPQLVTIKVDAQLYLLDLTPSIKVSNVQGAPSPYTYRTGDVSYRVVEITTGGVKQLLLARAADCTLAPTTDSTPYAQADIDKAVVADRAKARITYA